MPDAGQEKSEYSLTQHLANNLIDLYINLPSKNNYRRPATYTSRGYKTRRMAVDFAVPLITNVKIAKLLSEALVRKMSLDVAPVDFKTSHITYSFPALVNVQAFVPGLMKKSSCGFDAVTKASVGAGFTTVLVMPFGVDGAIVDDASLHAAWANAKGGAFCNYALSVSASPSNSTGLDEDLQAETKALFIPFNSLTDQNVNKVAAVAAHFASWPEEKPIITDARSTDLATILLLASLHNRSVHVTDVGSRDDILLIALSKAKELKVTCDVSIYSLFFNKEKYPASTHLPSVEDQDALWGNLAAIDIFSIGTAPYRLALDLGEEYAAESGLVEALPLLLTAVSQGRLNAQDIQIRLHDNPIRIFDLPEQAHSRVEVDMNRRNIFSKDGHYWSPLDGAPVVGGVHRVVLHDQTVYLDGTNLSKPMGRDLSSSSLKGPAGRPSVRTSSFASTARPVVLPDGPSTALTQRPVETQNLAIASLSLSSRDRSPARSWSLPPPHPAFHRRHILSVKQFSHRDIHHLFDIAHEMRLQVERNGVIDLLKGRILCSVFYEPSTRTSSSFETAMKRLGGEVVSITADQSSVMKGESLADTVRTLACYGDAIVLRHPAVGSAVNASKFSPIPIINAGDGIGEHPTQVSELQVVRREHALILLQALLDIFTIRSELGTVNGRTVTLLGDLLNGRTVHSLVTLLSFYTVRLNFVSPPSLAMPDSVVATARKAGIPIYQCNSVDEVLADTDVLYVTRVQQERFESEEEFQRVKKTYVVDHALLARAKQDMIVMHPLPRLGGKPMHNISSVCHNHN